MRRDPRLVLDTNVLISGLFGIKNSPSSKILHAVRTQTVILVTSPILLQELEEVLRRERIMRLTKMTPGEQKDFLDQLIERSDVTAGKQLSYIIGRDIKDDKFLACALEGNADYIVTGDDDLLVLKEYEGIKVVSPRTFVEILD